MPGISVLHDNEIKIDDTFFPIKGRVQVTNITVTPNPVIFGDTNQQGDTQVLSQLLQSSVVGGSGIYKGNVRTDTERSWTSGAETRYRAMICLPPLAVDMSKPSGLTSEILEVSIDFRNIQYFVFANKVYTWLESVQSWSTLEHTLATIPSDIVVYKNHLYVACGTSIECRTAAGAWSVISDDALLLAEWDSRLWKLASISDAYEIAYSTDGTTWTAAGQYTAPNVPHQLITYRDATGASALYLITDSGPWIYDATNQRFLETEVRVPRVESTSSVRAAVFRDGKMYFTSGGLGMVSMQSGNPTIAAPVGLDQDDGVPAGDLGKFSALAADFGWLLALVDSAGSSENDKEWITMGGPFEGFRWSRSEGAAKLKAWQGGWHTLWESQVSGTPGTVLVVSGAYDKHRIYWAQGASVFYMDVPNEIHNPRHNPNRVFAPGPVTHITPWWAYGTESQTKIHGHFYLRTTGCSGTERISVYYSTDLDDNDWILLDVITSNGRHELRIGGAVGVPGDFFRFRFDLERGSDSSKSPFLEFWASEIMRTLPATYAFGFEIDLTQKEHRGRTPLQLLQQLQRLADASLTPGFVQFAYRDISVDAPSTYYGKIMRLAGQEEPGSDLSGVSSYLVSFVAPYSQDAI